MSVREVIWRLSQKQIQNSEKHRYKDNKTAVTSHVFNAKLSNLRPAPSKLFLNFNNNIFGTDTGIHLLSGASYEDYKRSWRAGFQTANEWPDVFAYELNYKQRDDIGDARTNWELNRHFQFALLAKAYYVSGKDGYLKELQELFADWNRENAFLYGISWTSVMEIAIRCSNWCYTYAFLEAGKAPAELLDQIRIGIINMTDYIISHYSRFSSANNHLIVEAFAIGQSGIMFEHSEWTDLAISILTREITLQNYDDGVNRELSLHYQAFYMEAMGLIMRLMKKNSISVPDTWNDMLVKMCRYLSVCMGMCDEVLEFGDDDEGKILDLCGEEHLQYYKYVLGMFSVLLDERYVDLEKIRCENIHWLFTEAEIKACIHKGEYVIPQYKTFPDGGITIMRSVDRKVLMGLDHGALGFGSIAAHGHADALSFQLYYCGKPVFIDPGTYIYHCDLHSRNQFRKTEWHNTVTVGGKDQSEMLGAFLWGKKANARQVIFKENENGVMLVCEQDGYSPIIHRRTIKYDGRLTIEIKDELSARAPAVATFIFAYDIKAVREGNNINLFVDEDRIAKMTFYGQSSIMYKSFQCSDKYGTRQDTMGVVIDFDRECQVRIELLDN